MHLREQSFLPRAQWPTSEWLITRSFGQTWIPWYIPSISIPIHRYYFVLEEGRVLAPFSITVTPCDVPIEWSILVYKSPPGFPGKATPGKAFGLPKWRQRKQKLLIGNCVIGNFPQAQTSHGSPSCELPWTDPVPMGEHGTGTTVGLPGCTNRSTS